MRRLGTRVIMDDLGQEGTDLSGGESVEDTTQTNDGFMTEEEALAGLIDSPTQEQETQTIDNPAPSTEQQEVDLSEIDLSFLGVENEATASEEQTQEVNPSVQEQQPNEMQEVLNRSDQMQKPNEQQEIPPEEMTALTELVGKLQGAGLIPQGMSEEDRTLLTEVKKMNDSFKEQEQYNEAVQVHQGKITTLENFSKTLETTIPGYDSKFMQNVVVQINQKNPEAAQKILDNPSELLELWAKVGAKSQPSQVQTNVISSNGNQQTNTNTGLEEKVRR